MQVAEQPLRDLDLNVHTQGQSSTLPYFLHRRENSNKKPICPILLNHIWFHPVGEAQC